MSLQRFLRLAHLREFLGEGTTAIYDDIKVGLVTPPVKLGRSSVWPENEIVEIQKAVIAGKPEHERKQLVSRLVAARTQSVA
jgi:predicted DNA-binding transcriptional regulator AlpA